MVEPSWFVDLLGTNLVVHQATGMMSAQMNLSLQEAALRLRAEATAAGSSVDVIAADVVAGRVRFPTEDQDPPSSP